MTSSGSFLVLVLSLILTFYINISNGAQISDEIKIEFIQSVKKSLTETFKNQNDFDLFQRQLLNSRNLDCQENLNQLMSSKNANKYFEFEKLLLSANTQIHHYKELIDLFNETVNHFFS
jgi:hypothetical protein